MIDNLLLKKKLKVRIAEDHVKNTEEGQLLLRTTITKVKGNYLILKKENFLPVPVMGNVSNTSIPSFVFHPPPRLLMLL